MTSTLLRTDIRIGLFALIVDHVCRHKGLSRLAGSR